MNTKRKKALTVVSKGDNDRLYHLTKLLEHLEFYNSMAPFPPYDSDYVASIKNELKRTKKMKKEEYDSLPVHYCAHCKSLHIEIDEKGHNICGRCGAVNEVKMAKNIDAYNKKYGKIWDLNK